MNKNQDCGSSTYLGSWICWIRIRMKVKIYRLKMVAQTGGVEDQNSALDGP
jgi:hypothetical protein